MDRTDSRADTEPVAETAPPNDAERDHFRYVLWSQARRIGARAAPAWSGIQRGGGTAKRLT